MAVVGLIVLAGFARAHDLTLDVIRIIQSDRKAFVSLGLHKSDPLAMNADSEIRKRLHILQNGHPIPIGKQVSSSEKSEDVTYWQAELLVPGDGEISLQGPLRPERKDMTTVLLVFQNGLLASQKTYKPETESESPGGFFRLGVEHLINGLDHILFVLSLVLVARRFREIAKVITAFTVAHCCTLALVVLKGVTLPPRMVEPLIALSIAVVAMQALLRVPQSSSSGRDSPLPTAEAPRKRNKAVYIAFIFGLIHGFGFAGGLIERGFDRTNIWTALLSFNFGLELAQLSIAFLGFGVLGLVGSRPKLQSQVIRVASLGFTYVAVYWFFQRITGS